MHIILRRIGGMTKFRTVIMAYAIGYKVTQELKFYYPYIRQNMADRVAAYLKKTEE